MREGDGGREGLDKEADEDTRRSGKTRCWTQYNVPPATIGRVLESWDRSI